MTVLPGCQAAPAWWLRLPGRGVLSGDPCGLQLALSPVESDLFQVCLSIWKVQRLEVLYSIINCYLSDMLLHDKSLSLSLYHIPLILML